MPETRPLHGVIFFGAFKVDTRSGEVHKHGIRLKLQDQPFRVLQILLEHSGEVVTRDELHRQIWPSDTFVDFERGLNNAVKRLREALGDSADSPRYVETLPRRGYRFIAPLEIGNADVDGTANKENPVVPRLPIPNLAKPWFLLHKTIVAAVGILLAGASLFALDVGGLRSRLLLKLRPPVIQSIAVLPLQNLSGNAAQEYFADGMTDGLISELSQISSVRIISRTSVMRYKRTELRLPEIARELNVDGIIEGSVQRSPAGDRVRITAQLLYAPTESHIWTETYERDLRDVFSLERELTEEIAHQIRAKILPQPQALPSHPRPVNVKALDAYLQGKHHFDRVGQGFGDEEADRAAEYFQQAINADPSFVQSYIGLAEAYNWRLLPSRESAAIMENARKKITELAPNSSVAALVSARTKQDDWNWKGAEAEYRRAIALDPNDVEAHRSFAKFLDWLARFDEGWKEWQVAQELNPNPDRLPSALDLPNALSIRGKSDQAKPLYLRVLEANPKDGQTHLSLADCYYRSGNYRGEIEELGKTAALYGHEEIETHLKQAYAANGYQAALRQWARELERLQSAKQLYMPAYLAKVYAELGDKERVFYWMEEAYRSHISGGLGSDMIPWLRSDPSLELIRSDPRYFDLLRRVGLDTEQSFPSRD